MKPKNTYPLQLTVLVMALLFVLQSCGNEIPGSWKNDEIKTGKRDDFHKLNEQLFKALKNKDIVEAKSMMSKELVEGTYSTSRAVDLIGNYLTDNKYNLLDEYYVVNKYKDFDTIKAKNTGVNSYDLYYPATAREMYFAFYVPESGNNRYIITTVYAKYSYGWKVSTLEVSPYTVNGKTAPELFKLAKEQFDKKYIINARNNMALAVTCLKPTSIWQYPEEGEIIDFNGKVITEAKEKCKFPIMINLPTRPMVLQVYTKENAEGTFPMVYYMTHINIKDTNEVKQENIQIKKILSKALPGIDKDNKYVYYEAFNRFPNSSVSVDRFYMVDKFK